MLFLVLSPKRGNRKVRVILARIVHYNSVFQYSRNERKILELYLMLKEYVIRRLHQARICKEQIEVYVFQLTHTKMH